MANLLWTKYFLARTIIITRNFLEKIINIISIYLLAPFIVQNFKKILTADPELWWCTIFGPIYPNENFSRKSVNKPCFFHSCLSTRQKSKSDINLLMKYWQLKNTEISLAKSHFWLKLENQIFPKHRVFAEC